MTDHLLVLDVLKFNGVSLINRHDMEIEFLDSVGAEMSAILFVYFVSVM